MWKFVYYNLPASKEHQAYVKQHCMRRDHIERCGRALFIIYEGIDARVWLVCLRAHLTREIIYLISLPTPALM